MDIVNDAEMPEGQTAELRNSTDLQNSTHLVANLPDVIADLPNVVRSKVKSCTLCCTPNHPLSRECFNCGWRGSVPLSTAVRPGNPQGLFQPWLVFFRRFFCIVRSEKGVMYE